MACLDRETIQLTDVSTDEDKAIMNTIRNVQKQSSRYANATVICPGCLLPFATLTNVNKHRNHYAINCEKIAVIRNKILQLMEDSL